MRVVVVTGNQPHHKNLCGVIARNHRVVGVIHPRSSATSLTTKARRLVRRAQASGWAAVAGQVMGKLALGRVLPNGESDSQAAFASGIEDYDKVCRPLVHSDCDVSAETTVSLLKSLQPDVTICLGGPVYPKAFIDASPVTLNFHSGISPFYNGAASIDFAFANGHPHLCGGTLMVMSTEVDGGGILGHYLPEISKTDTPRSLFLKTVGGAAKMYLRLLEYFQTAGFEFQFVPQPPALFYTRGFEFSWHHRRMIERHVRQHIGAKFGRAEQIVEYWPAATADAAREQCSDTLDRLLWQSTTFNGNHV